MGNSSPLDLLNSDTPSRILENYKSRFIIAPAQLTAESKSSEKLSYLLHEKISHNKYLLRILKVDQQQGERIETLIIRKLAYSNRIGLSSQLSLSISHVQYPLKIKLIPIIEYHLQNIGDLTKIYILFNLGKSIKLSDCLILNAIRQNQNNQFNESKLLNSLKGLVKALQMLKFLGHPPNCISPDTVYIDDKQQLYLSDPWMSESDSQFLDLGYHEEYQAPEVVESKQYGVNHHDTYTAGIFSIGLIGLKVMNLLKPPAIVLSKQCNQDKQTIDFAFLKKEIQTYCQNPELCELFYCLLGSIEERISFFNNAIKINKTKQSKQHSKSQTSTIHQWKESNSPIKWPVSVQESIRSSHQPKQEQKMTKRVGSQALDAHNKFIINEQPEIMP